VHQFGVIKECLKTVDARYKHEDGITYLLTYLISYLITPRSRVLLEKLPSSQIVKIYLAFYGNRKFITAFTKTFHLSLS